MTDYPKVEILEDGWTDWILPVMDSYKMQCCDCGLKHEFQFEIGTESERSGDEFIFTPLEEPHDYRVAMRGKRLEEFEG